MVSQAPIHSSAVARLRSRRDGATERRLCFLAIGDNGASTLTFHALPSPSAASKFLALLVALVALSTANAAILSGSAGAGYPYTTVGSLSAGDITAVTALSTAIDGYDWTTFDASAYNTDIATHFPAAGTATRDDFCSHYSDNVAKNYITDTIVSSEFQDLNPQISHPEARRVVTRP